MRSRRASSRNCSHKRRWLAYADWEWSERQGTWQLSNTTHELLTFRCVGTWWGEVVRYSSVWRSVRIGGQLMTTSGVARLKRRHVRDFCVVAFEESAADQYALNIINQIMNPVVVCWQRVRKVVFCQADDGRFSERRFPRQRVRISVLSSSGIKEDEEKRKKENQTFTGRKCLTTSLVSLRSNKTNYSLFEEALEDNFFSPFSSNIFRAKRAKCSFFFNRNRRKQWNSKEHQSLRS